MQRRAFTIIETAVVAGAIAVAASAAQMAALATAHAMYASDFNDRQFTLCPDDLGVYNGN